MDDFLLPENVNCKKSMSTRITNTCRFLDYLLIYPSKSDFGINIFNMPFKVIHEELN